jgi:hypothetical protein
MKNILDLKPSTIKRLSIERYVEFIEARAKVFGITPKRANSEYYINEGVVSYDKYEEAAELIQKRREVRNSMAISDYIDFQMGGEQS